MLLILKIIACIYANNLHNIRDSNRKGKKFCNRKFNTKSINVIDIKDLIFRPSMAKRNIQKKGHNSGFYAK